VRGDAGDVRAASVTTLLGRAGAGDRQAVSELVPLVYEELRELAQGRMGRLAPGQTLQATDLVHEAWMRLGGGASGSFEDRAHFFGAAANAMRNVLVDRARRKALVGREPASPESMADELPEIEPGVGVEDLLALHEALARLEAAHERPARIVLLRFFAGLTLPEAAELAGVSLATAERDWRFARAWLQHEMGAGEA
jgi:RNA polymerase sigma factor (TIGR02999 family)